MTAIARVHSLVVRAHSLDVSDLASETKGSRLTPTAGYVQRGARYCRSVGSLLYVLYTTLLSDLLTNCFGFILKPSFRL